MFKIIPLALILAAAPALAQPVSPAHSFAWEENIGWTNWFGDDNGKGVTASATFLSGWLWCENAGWVHVGDGTPADGVRYKNANNSDFGVNIANNGDLSGYGWGENIGWINFAGGAKATPAKPARLDAAAARLRGWAWGENIGWLNLDDADAYIGFSADCYADCTGDGALDLFDFLCFVNAFNSSDTYADCTGDGAYDLFDFLCFVNAFNAGC